jgi:hypothetical protein
MSKYYLCEFHEQNGEFEYNHHHVYSDEFLNKNKINISDDNNDVKLLNYFFGKLAKMIKMAKATGLMKD